MARSGEQSLSKRYSGLPETTKGQPHALTAHDLGIVIRNKRKSLKMTQADLAMQVGVSVPTVSAIENGKDTAQIGLVLEICRDLGLRFRVEA